MQKAKKYVGFISLFTALIIVLTACGNAGSTTPSNGNDNQVPEPSPATRIVKTVNGDLEIPAEPKRVVAQGYMATLLALGVKPIGAPFWDIESPHVQGMTDGIEDIGNIDSSSIEKILSLQPDLIVTLSNDTQIYEQLSKIAPTVVYTYDTFKDTRDEIREFGKLLGKEEEAEAWVADFNETVKAAKAQIQGIIGDDETVTVMGGFDKGLYIYASGVWRGVQAIYSHLELTPPPRVQEIIEAGKDLEKVSFELVPEFAGDYIFLDSPQEGLLDREGSVWNTLDAVKQNRVFDLDGDYFWPYDPIAIKAQVQKVAEMLSEWKQAQ